MEIDRYIEQAESILLNGGTFDDERKIFIRNLETCDLLAVPGSGKTTALLAKLYCIAQNMPFEDGSGILILSHTNKAIEEIEKKLKNYCPRLFEYPNFIGTVQTFVNKFLANQACFEKYGTYIKKNDDELYEYEVKKFYYSLVWSSRGVEPKNLVNKLYGKANYNKYNLTSPEKINNTINFIKNLELDLIGKKIVYGSNQTTLYIENGSAHNFYLQIKEWKENLFKNGLLNYKDSFNIGLYALSTNSNLKNVLQKRFKYVFIDEMQDLEDFQINIIDDIFFSDSSQTTIQRIGDKNQSIYNSVKENCDWITRQDFDSENYTDLTIQNSMRLSPSIANLVDKFVLKRPENYSVIGKFEESTIPPHLILIDQNTTGESLKTKFKEIIEENNLHFESKNLEKGFHIVSWTTDKDDVFCLKKLFPKFSKESKKKNFDCLKKHLFLFEKEKPTLEAIRKSTLNALIRILDLENIKNEDGKFYTKRQLINFFKNQGEEFYNDFIGKLFKWCFEIITKENYSEIYGEIKNFIESENFIGLNWNNEESFTPKTITNSRDFINKDFPFISEEENETEESEIDNYPIHLSSVHSVKGQTHCATMYIESYYYEYETKKLNVVIPATRKKLEEVLPNPLLNQHQAYRSNKDARAKETLKMMYVGFSRPTHLLCFAVLKENIHEHLESLKIENGGIWKVIDITTN